MGGSDIVLGCESFDSEGGIKKEKAARVFVKIKDLFCYFKAFAALLCLCVLKYKMVKRRRGDFFGTPAPSSLQPHRQKQLDTLKQLSFMMG